MTFRPVSASYERAIRPQSALDALSRNELAWMPDEHPQELTLLIVEPQAAARLPQIAGFRGVEF